MSDVFQTDEHAYRACILYEAVRETPIEEAYENMQKMKSNVDFLDFEYWYLRFSNGNHDLGSKTCGLSDMPVNVVDNIVGNLGLVDKLSTQKVCRQLRTIIDNQTATITENVSMKISIIACEIQLGTQEIIYCDEETKIFYLETPRKILVSTNDPWKMGVKDFASMITHPNWKFQNLNIEFNWEDYNEEDNRKPIQFLDSLLSNRVVHVENLKMKASTVKPMAALLPRFHGISSLDFEFKHITPHFLDDSFSKILKMDQWKNAKQQLRIAGWILEDFPIEKLFHAKNITVFQIGFTKKRLEMIRDILFKSPNFESCSLGHFSDDTDLEDLPRAVDRVMGAHKAYNHRQKRYRIGNSKDYFQISYRRDDEINLAPDDLFLEIRKIRA